MFSVWIGGRPPEFEMNCMMQNNAKYGLTLIAEKNWVGAKRFIAIGPLLEEMANDIDCAHLLTLWDNPRNVSDVLRLWWLRKNPSEVYVDSDCHIQKPIPLTSKVQVPSCQSAMEEITKAHGVILDTQGIKNTAGHFVEVYLIAGNGDCDFFDRWISTWSNRYDTRGGIAEALCYEPFDVSIIPSTYYSHLSNRKQKWSVHEQAT